MTKILFENEDVIVRDRDLATQAARLREVVAAFERGEIPIFAFYAGSTHGHGVFVQHEGEPHPASLRDFLDAYPALANLSKLLSILERRPWA